MKKIILSTLVVAAALTNLNASSITILDQKSPEFPLGKQTHINMKFVPDDASDMWLKAGVRIQGTFESKTSESKVAGSTSSTIQDAYLRRVRFEVAAGFGHGTSFVMDIRNDKSNYGIENSEGKFNVGDAYVKIKKPFDTSLVNFKLYRGKIDISRTETVKSARVIAYDRPYVADIAAQYISFNRRGTNVQMYGDWEKKIHYQVAVGAATSPTKIYDAAGDKAASDGFEISEQSFFVGGKVRFSPLDGWEEKKRTETYFGKGKHFSVGAAYWLVPTLKGTSTNSTTSNVAVFDKSRSLLNIEASMHYYGLFLQAEYFKFGNAVKDWNPTSGNIETGDSTGWYATGEYVMPNLNYMAPFARYESHERYEDVADTTVTSAMAGINWYLKGNSIKAGFYYQQDEYALNAGNKDTKIFRVTSQFFF